MSQALDRDWILTIRSRRGNANQTSFPAKPMASTKTVAFVLFDDALALNVAGPAEAFCSANRLSGGSVPLYRLVYLSTTGGLVRTGSGMSIHTEAIATVDAGGLDTIIVVGGATVAEAMRDTALIDWIAHASTVARRTCSVCTGAFLLAAAHLLDGRRAVTHWASVGDLLAQFPTVDVQLDPIYINDGNIWTSAGISAGIDLALTLVAADHDRRLSLAVARDLVVFLHRPGDQAQFSLTLASQTEMSTRDVASRLSVLYAWIVEHLDEALTVERLAERVKMTPRTFARKFVEAYGRTSTKLVEDLRFETARRHLEEGCVSIKKVASLCGFGDEERMRRVFMRRLHVSPASYRERFSSTG
jgi:transcriptional regulator GlxA family with amidase domain